MSRRFAALIAIAGLVAAACSFLPQPSVEELPKPCVASHSVARCQALTDTVAADIGKDRDDVDTTLIVPDPIPKGVTLGGAWGILVRIVLKDGATHDMKLCEGVAMEPACQEDPRLGVASAINGGYRDVPEGSTPLPSLMPRSVDGASPIIVDSMRIPIDRKGPQEIPLGEGSIPDGVWSTGTLDLTDTWPDDFALRDGQVVLELRSLERDGRPFDNYYVHGWRTGVEHVRALLTFDVLWFKPGATLDIRNVIIS
jgi:hypothetical protein